MSSSYYTFFFSNVGNRKKGKLGIIKLWWVGKEIENKRKDKNMGKWWVRCSHDQNLWFWNGWNNGSCFLNLFTLILLYFLICRHNPFIFISYLFIYFYNLYWLIQQKKKKKKKKKYNYFLAENGIYGVKLLFWTWQCQRTRGFVHTHTFTPKEKV